MSDLAIRRLDATDAPACAEIVLRWIEATEWMPNAGAREVVETSLREGLPKREAWGIGAPLEGYISINAEECHIGGFYVSVPGKGRGRMLMERAKEGRDFLKLNSHAANTRAHGFYRREGFEIVGEPWLGSDGIDEISMEWHR